ncbi:ABC transporter ATP-binding protein [Cohnella nanjingensis]|uniref:ABC transporter ATP-binding protein n=2 Tax=Cohnella nanjingensis TaxID=1387779 RepID=A0A7X0RX31_9BACL|nr:ABC transporter ATP-binding protein [Cohnella nanjingensis]
MSPAIDLNKVTKRFGKKVAVQELSLRVERGTSMALLGRNGAGKTTTLSMLLGVSSPTEGRLSVLGGKPTDAKVRDRLGAMMQEVSVIERLRVEETIELVRKYYDKPLPLRTLLDWSGLTPHAKLMTQGLSGGQKRRLSFALALAGDPELLFLDEPTVGMDIESRQRFWETIEQLKARGKTLILTTHHMDEAERIADRVVVIDEGILKADGTLDEIRRLNRVRTMTFTAGPDVTPERLRALIGGAETAWDGRRVRLTAADTDRLLRTLIRDGADISDIEISAGGLEQALQTIWSRERKGETA